MEQDDRALLRRMVELYSPATHEAEIAAFLVEEMRRRGFRAHLDDVGNAVGEVGSGTRQIALIGHIDTAAGLVPVREEHGLLYGRGAVDAKGSFAAFICAAARLVDLTDKRITLVGAVEEESPTSRGAWHLVDRMRPDCVLIGEPSGWESITIGYKGIVGLRYRLDRPNTHFAGSSVRAGQEAIRFYNAFAHYVEARSGHGEFDSPRLELRRFTTHDDGLRDSVEVYLAVRVPPGFEADDLLEYAGQEAGAAQVVCDQRVEGIVADKNSPIVRALLRGIRQMGGRPTFKKKTGTSDMCIVGPAWGCPIVAYGPGDSRLDHTPDEHLSLDEYDRAIQVLATALKAL